MKRSRSLHEVKFSYNPNICSLNYRFVNARYGQYGLNDSKSLAGACARGLVNTHGGQRGLLHQLSPICTFDVGIVAMAQEARTIYRQCVERLIASHLPRHGAETTRLLLDWA